MVSLLPTQRKTPDCGVAVAITDGVKVGGPDSVPVAGNDGSLRASWWRKQPVARCHRGQIGRARVARPRRPPRPGWVALFSPSGELVSRVLGGC